MAITASRVKELRERTGAGMMECKKALTETNDDMEAAIELLRKKGAASAEKKSGRVTAEGVIVQRISEDGTAGVMVEVNCETDFVAKDSSFNAFAGAVGDLVLSGQPENVEALSEMEIPESGTVENTRQALIGKIGENISVRRFVRLEAPSGGSVSGYLHGARIGVLVATTAKGPVGRDIAMHVAASRPICIAEGDMPPDLLAKEREIYRAQAIESGKPENIVEKMVEGRVRKFLEETTLLGQKFVKDPDISVGKLLEREGLEVTSMARLEVGEGLEKRSDDFVAEVMAQAQGG